MRKHSPLNERYDLNLTPPEPQKSRGFLPMPGARKQRAGKAVYGAEGRLPNVDRFDSALSLHFYVPPHRYIVLCAPLTE